MLIKGVWVFSLSLRHTVQGQDVGLTVLGPLTWSRQACSLLPLSLWPSKTVFFSVLDDERTVGCAVMHGRAEELTHTFRGQPGLGWGGLISSPHFYHLGTVSEKAKHPVAHGSFDSNQPRLVSQTEAMVLNTKLRYDLESVSTPPFKTPWSKGQEQYAENSFGI